MLRLLCEHGASTCINNPDEHGRTALSWAVERQDIAIVRYLLEHGAAKSINTAALYFDHFFNEQMIRVEEPAGKKTTLQYAYDKISDKDAKIAGEIVALLESWLAKTETASNITAQTITHMLK